MVNNLPDTDRNTSPVYAPNGVQPKKQLTLPAFVLADLENVDQAMHDLVESNSALINAAGHYVLSSGGKRLRASLALLSAHLATYDFERVLHSATTVELIHVASLVHDDLVDEAERRRGLVAVHTRWDHGVALMVGDYFFALASSELAQMPDPRIITYFSSAVKTICEGELAPVMTTTPFETASAQYYNKIGCKTASLFEAACKAGIASCGGTPEQIEILGRFGYDLGLAFQVVDDILDFTGDEKLLGKPAGSDLRHGVITLPLIHTVAASEHNQWMSTVVDSQDPKEIARAVAEVQRVGIEPTWREAYALVDRALEHLHPFAGHPVLETFQEIARFVLERDK